MDDLFRRFSLNPGGPGAAGMTLRRAHRLNALALAAFILLHLGNHLVIFLGADAHLAVLRQLRHIYRLPGIEHLLFGLFAVQILLGLVLAQRLRQTPVPWRRVQMASGMVLALFLVQHLSAVLLTRWAYPDVDTNTYWAASVVSRAPLSWYFVPYYILGIAALCLHLIAALRAHWPRRALAWAALSVSGLIVGGFMGLYHPLVLPTQHQAYLERFWPDAE